MANRWDLILAELEAIARSWEDRAAEICARAERAKRKKKGGPSFGAIKNQPCRRLRVLIRHQGALARKFREQGNEARATIARRLQRKLAGEHRARCGRIVELGPGREGDPGGTR